MSGGCWNYMNDSAASEILGYHIYVGYGLDSDKHEKNYKQVIRDNPLGDPEISALVYDVFCLLHSYDWAESGDTDMDAYQKDVEIFKIALEEIEGCIADQKTVEDEIEARELARIIEAFLDTLTEKQRIIFMRRYAYADTYADIAKRVGISEKNVSVRLTLIRQKMKQYLIEQEVFV